MAFVELTIVRPTKGQVFVLPLQGSAPIAFEGAAQLPTSLRNVRMYYRWYSSLNPAVNDQPACYALNATALTAAGQVYHHPDLPMGSQVIALAASDQPAEADIAHSQHGGVTGGADQSGNGHLIHVLRAKILAPGSSASRAGLRLQAEAPWAWEYHEYHRTNRLRYRWVLTPLGTATTPQGNPRPTLAWTPTRGEMGFTRATAGQPPAVSIARTLPAEAIGRYEVLLFVEDVDNPVAGRQATDRLETLLT